MAVQNQARLCTKICDAFLKNNVTAAERGLGELINVTFFYIYKQNLMNSCSMTVHSEFDAAANSHSGKSVFKAA